jgi:hypothetical protein
MQFRTVDVFVKPRHDLQTKSIVGGIITLIAATCSISLLVAQLFWYMVGTTRQSLHVTESRSIPMLPPPPSTTGGESTATTADRRRHQYHDRLVMEQDKGKIPVTIHVTFPHLNCDVLQVQWNDAALQPEDFDPIHSPSRSLDLRKPRSTELISAGLLKTKEQHQQHLKEIRKDHGTLGCTLHTVLRLPIVAGSLTISMTRKAWNDAARAMMMHAQQQQFLRDSSSSGGGGGGGTVMPVLNVSHYIHSIQFGTPFPPQAASYPLESKWHVVDNPTSIMTGISSLYLQVKLIPTLYQRGAPFVFFLGGLGTFHQETYQLSLVDHPIKAETLLSTGIPYLPGLTIAYDFTALAVHHTHDARDNILVFLSSLVSIVGGAFVTVGLLTGCLVRSAQAALSKKID